MTLWFVAGVGGILLSLVVETRVLPAAPRRAAAAVAMHSALFVLLFLAIGAILRRPFLTAALVLVPQVTLVLVSNAKWRALREPLVHADLLLFAQAFRHPRLYLPYLSWVPVVIALLAGAAALSAAVLLEPQRNYAPQLALPAALCALAVLAWGLHAAGQGLSLDLPRDVARNGLAATLTLYWIREWKEKSGALPATPFSSFLGPRFLRSPHIVAVQCESFFDARRAYGGVSDRVLKNYDSLRATGASGLLAVPAWGAYTMRTEFAFLSAIEPAMLGVHRFNPYRRFARRPIATLASCLRGIGYRTICVHPYPSSFFRRDLVFGHLGFDEFHDLREFAHAARAGPYVADAEVARKVSELLRASPQPIFVFAITMESHGPLHLERASSEDARSVYRNVPPEGCDDLTVYLRHLRNADAMLGTVAGALRQHSGDGVLCAFGDHVPSLPRVYEARGYVDGRTNYLLWRPGASEPRVADLAVEALGVEVLRFAGIRI